MILYLLSVALILAACFIFYKVLLQQETFFPLNRFILIGCLALSFSVPLIPIPQEWSFRKANSEIEILAQPTPQISAPSSKKTAVNGPVQQKKVATAVVESKQSSFFKDLSIYDILIWTYWLGVVIFAVNFIVQLSILLYKAYSKPVINDGPYRIIELSGDEAPCSFGNNIFINPEKYDWDTYSQILLHEKIHIQQGHSYDILFAELAIIFQWFNPFAWLYRKAVEDNLEFLTDNELLEKSNIERSSYQMSLVKVSVPRFPVSLTTNYNQSILKKRLIMMNAKKSNVNSTWKYLFIIPLLLLFISLLNEPVAHGSTNANKTDKLQLMETEGSWFATIKNDKVTIRFESDEDGKSHSSSTFSLSEFKNLPRDKEGDFNLTREPGTIDFKGKFEGNTGMGTYKFNPDATFISFLAKEGVTAKDKDALVFYMVKLNRGFVKMLKTEGYDNFSKDDLIPLAALNVNAEFIQSLKKAGLENMSLKDLIPLKALDIDGAYVKDIKSSGYKNVTADNLITLKAQGITGDFIKDAKSSSSKSFQGNTTDDQMLALTNSKGPKGNKGSKGNKNNNNDSDDESDAFGELIAKKVLNITPVYAKSFADIGFNLSDSELIAMKSMGVTTDFIKEFEQTGLKLSADQAISLKSLSITANDIGEYKKLGFKKLTLDDVIAAKSTGTSTNFISSMRKKGHDYASIDKYISMKVLSID